MTSAEHPPAVVEQPVLDDLRARLPRRPDRRLGRLLRLAVGYERYVVSAGDVGCTVFSRDELLTWITAYWVSGAIDVRSWTEASGGGHFAAWDEVFRAAGGR